MGGEAAQEAALHGWVGRTAALIVMDRNAITINKEDGNGQTFKTDGKAKAVVMMRVIHVGLMLCSRIMKKDANKTIPTNNSR